MTDCLVLGDYAYSSWSLRGWLLFENFGLSTPVRLLDFHDEASVAEQLALPPAATVPTWITPGGTPVWDSLAIAEELASRHPGAGHWPADPEARAVARSLVAEMHSGFSTLRTDCPMNLRAAYAESPVSDALASDLARLEAIWAFARAHCGCEGPWLCGAYCAADAFFAPVAARIAGYALPVGAAAAAYVAAHLADPAFRRWRAMALAAGKDLPWYARDYPRAAWPGPEPRTARAVTQSMPENAACPYSGRPATHLMEMSGRVFGFCNRFCRDKTATDPEAWPAFMALV